ncbi:GGDEF domain-containing protein [Roseateles sp. SL47]|nr:GGDEF domain-containing protein [Roseateles sp. SL47]
MEELRAANEQLATFALTDPLTGLPNRRALFDELQRLIQRASRDGSSLLVGCIDLDGFKAINDRLGHQAGDRFLQEVAQRLSLEMRGSDMLARMGGDEFVVVGPGVDLRARPASSGPSLDHADALQAAHTLEQRASLATVGRFELDGQFVQYGGASVGVVPLNPVGLTAEEALQLADARMYEVKRARQQQRLATADVAS